MLSRVDVGWLMLAAALLVFTGGIGLRVLTGRNRERSGVQRVVGGFRATRLARALFGPVTNDALDDDELDQLFVMPSIVLSCGLCLTAIFLLGYELVT